MSSPTHSPSHYPQLFGPLCHMSPSLKRHPWAIKNRLSMNFIKIKLSLKNIKNFNPIKNKYFKNRWKWNLLPKK